MSFIIAVHVNEGIVLASDSRSTYSLYKETNGQRILHNGIHRTDTTNKTFLCRDRFGLATCGVNTINGMPLAGYIEAFIRDKIIEKTKADEIPQLLIDYFHDFTPVPDTNFIVAGYQEESGNLVQKIFKVQVAGRKIEKINTNLQGATWDGEILTLVKVLKSVALKKQDGTYEDLQCNEIPFNLFNLQDAINFARFAVDITIQTMHFQNVIETVGGPVDILVLKPEKSFWVEKKELY